MARPAHPVALSPTDHSALTALVKKGTHKSRKITRARALLLMGAGKRAAVVQAEAGICANQYYGLKRRYLAGGLADALDERPRSGQPPKVTPALEAHITRLACSTAPTGAARWTLSLLNESLVSLQYVETISNKTIRQVLKKVNSNPGLNRCGVSVP
jgi:transposase